MRVSIALLVLTLALSGGLALADIPPQPDLYSGPSKIEIGGLKFVRRSPQRTLSPEHQPGLLSETYIFLDDCTASHPNCRRAKEHKVLGYVVGAINGALVRNDLGAFQAAFNSTPKGHKVKLTLGTQGNVEPSREIDVIFDRN